VCGLILPSSYPCTLNAARLNATSPLERTFDMALNCPLIRARTQRLIAALGIAMPLATNWQASEKAAYYQRFLFFLDPRSHDEVHGFCASYWLSQRTASLIKSAWVVGRQLGITFACPLAFSIREHLLQPNCIAKRGAPRCACPVRIRDFAATWAGPCVRVSGYFATDAP